MKNETWEFLAALAFGALIGFLALDARGAEPKAAARDTTATLTRTDDGRTSAALLAYQIAKIDAQIEVLQARRAELARKLGPLLRPAADDRRTSGTKGKAK